MELTETQLSCIPPNLEGFGAFGSLGKAIFSRRTDILEIFLECFRSLSGKAEILPCLG